MIVRPVWTPTGAGDVSDFQTMGRGGEKRSGDREPGGGADSQWEGRMWVPRLQTIKKRKHV